VIFEFVLKTIYFTSHGIHWKATKNDQREMEVEFPNKNAYVEKRINAFAIGGFI
jgi:hypothetical protein